MDNLDKLREYNDKTTISGIIMPNLEVFSEKALMAISLWPQKSNDSINYLFGKGFGVELALRGQVVGREKNGIDFPYRSHSDFEIYNASSNQYKDMPESVNFCYVFGAQEIYPKTKTKALKNLPKNLMDNTYEKVLYNGNIYLIPSLELLFLDKFLRKEATPRNEGYDADLLAMQYNLDINLVFNYLNEYYILPEKLYFYESIKDLYDIQVENLNKLISKLRVSYNTNNLDEIQNLLQSEFKNYRAFNNVIKDGVQIAILPEQFQLKVGEGDKIELSEESRLEIYSLIEKKKVEKENEFEQLKISLIQNFKNYGYEIGELSNNFYNK